MLPPLPATPFTVYVSIAKLAFTVQAPLIAPVVYVEPERLPPQPVALTMW